MNDLEHDLRTLLDEKSREAGVPQQQPPPRTIQRARRRQLGTVLATVLTVTAVVAGSILGMRALLDRSSGTTVADTRDPSAAPDGYRSVALPFASIAYPKGWYLVDLVGSPGSRLQLSNFDAGFTEPCFSGDAAPLPPDGVVLLVEAGSGFTGEGSPRWPVDLPYDPSPSACRSGGSLESPEPGVALHYSATWTGADGTSPYTANAMIGPEASQADRDALDLAFGSLTVVEGAAQTEAFAGSPALVLDAADTPLGPVVLYAYDAGDDPDVGGLWIGVAGPAGSHFAGSGSVGDRPPTEDENVTMIIGERSLVWGDVSAEAARAEFRTAEGGTYPATLVPLPPSLGAEGIQAVWGVVDAPTEERITTVLFDESGVMLNDVVPTAPREVLGTGVDPDGGPWEIGLTHDTMGTGLFFGFKNGGSGGSCCIRPLGDGQDLQLDTIGSGGGEPSDITAIASTDVARVAYLSAKGETFEGFLFPMPDAYIGAAQVALVLVPQGLAPDGTPRGRVDGTLVAYDALGNELERVPAGGDLTEPAGPTTEIDAAWQLLRLARDAVSGYGARHPLTELTLQTLANLRPDVVWSLSTEAVSGQVSVGDLATDVDPATGNVMGSRALLQTAAASGETYCLVVEIDDGGGASYRYGHVHAETAAECRGGWD